VVDRLGCLSMATACITTMRDQTCLVLCKLHFSLAIWRASAMASFSCLGLSVFVPLCSLFVTFTGRSSVNRGLSGHLGRILSRFCFCPRERCMIFCDK
jgi:hypothetical protein